MTAALTRPTFAVVGTQKSATTWLFECLNEHPDICVPAAKELHYFCSADDCRFSRADSSEAWYASQFPDGPYKAWGELTTDYMFFPYVAEALYSRNPAMKIIFLLRNPVERAYSAYWMWRRHKTDLPPFDEMLEREPAFVDRGLYHRQIVPYLNLFGPDQVRIYIYEELSAEPEAFLADLYEFLGADRHFKPTTIDRSVGASNQLRTGAGFVVYKVVSPIINLPYVLPVWRWLRKRTRIHETALKLLSHSHEGTGYTALSDTDRARLTDIFRDENHRLFELLGREIPSWRN